MQFRSSDISDYFSLVPYGSRLLITIVFALNASACVVFSGDDEGSAGSSQLAHIRCRWSYECPDALVCTNSGYCASIDKCGGRLPSRIADETGYGIRRLREDNTVEGTPFPGVQNLDPNAYVTALTSGDSSLLSQHLSAAASEQIRLEAIIDDAQALEVTLRQYAQIHRIKQTLRAVINVLKPLTADQVFLGGATWKSRLIECADDWFLPWFSGTRSYYQEHGRCLDYYQQALEALGNVVSQTLIPVTELRKALASLEAQGTAPPSEALSCGQYARMVELPSAMESYARLGLQSAYALSDTFPITDVSAGGDSCGVVKGLGVPSLGEIAVGLHERKEAGQLSFSCSFPGIKNPSAADVFAHALNSALFWTRQYHETLLHRTAQRSWTAEELVPITLLNEAFLTEHPEFQQLHAMLLKDVQTSGRALVWAGLACGLGSVAGSLVLGGIPALAFAGGLCIAEAFFTVKHAVETSHLLQLARTFRYFGVEDTLETFERTQSLARQSRLEWALAIASIGFATYDIFRTVQLIDQLRLGHRSWYELRHRSLLSELAYDEPIFLNNDILAHYRAQLAEWRTWTDFRAQERIASGRELPQSHWRAEYELRVLSDAIDKMAASTRTPTVWGSVPELVWTPEELRILAQYHGGELFHGNGMVSFNRSAGMESPHVFVSNVPQDQVDAIRRQYSRRFYDSTQGFGSQPSVGDVFPLQAGEDPLELLQRLLMGYEREVDIFRQTSEGPLLIRFGERDFNTTAVGEVLVIHGHPWSERVGGGLHANDGASGAIQFNDHLRRWEVVPNAPLRGSLADTGAAYAAKWYEMVIASPVRETVVTFPWGSTGIVHTPLGAVEAYFPPLK